MDIFYELDNGAVMMYALTPLGRRLCDRWNNLESFKKRLEEASVYVEHESKMINAGYEFYLKCMDVPDVYKRAFDG